MRTYKIERSSAEWVSIYESLQGRVDPYGHTKEFIEDIEAILKYDNNLRKEDGELPERAERS